MLLFVLDNKVREARAPFLNSFGQKFMEVACCILNGADPKREGFPSHVVFTGFLQTQPR